MIKKLYFLVNIYSCHILGHFGIVSQKEDRKAIAYSNAGKKESLFSAFYQSLKNPDDTLFQARGQRGYS